MIRCSIAPTVSVIITCYNNADTVSDCIDSVLAQTTLPFEIIVVNDGSTDSTEKVLQKYALYDLVHVHSKKNGGAAQARNYGVARSGGELLTFVDGDDVVAPYYIESLIDAHLSNNADVVIGKMAFLSEAAMSDLRWQKPAGSEAYSCSSKDAIKEILYERIPTSACAKLLRRTCYEVNPFLEGHYYEDIAIACDHLVACERCAVIPYPIYGYVMRSGSITHRSDARIEQALDYERAIRSLETTVLAHFPELKESVEYNVALESSRLYYLLRVVSGDDSCRTDLENRAKSRVRTAFLSIMRNGEVSIFSKLRMAIFCVQPHLHNRLLELYKRRKHNIPPAKEAK